jgi:AcrR family transcriptional regulator
MRYSQEQIAASREAIVKAAGQIFREKGVAGAGIDGIANAAGLTSGSFYKHFAGKADAVREVVQRALQRAAARVKLLQRERKGGPDWVNDFATTYMSREHLAALGQGCALPVLPADVAREDHEIRNTFAEGLNELFGAMTEEAPLNSQDGRAKAAAIMSLLSGGAALARATSDEEQARLIADSVRRAALMIADSELPAKRPSRAKWSPPK